MPTVGASTCLCGVCIDDSSLMTHQAQNSGSFSNNCCRSEQIFQVIDSAPDDSSLMTHQAQNSGSFSNNCCRSEQIFQVIDFKAGQARSSTGLVLVWTEYLFCLTPLKGAAAEHQLISSLAAEGATSPEKSSYLESR